MIRTQVQPTHVLIPPGDHLQPTHVSIPPRNHQQIPEFNLQLKEQECLSLLKRCKNMEEFKQAHAQILKCGLFWNSFCASNLVATCALSVWGSMGYACSIFHRICEPGTFEFNTMIRGHVQDMNYEEALVVYADMLERGIEPDNFTFPALLKACALLRALEEGMQIHGQILKLRLHDDLYVQNSLINLYGKCKKIESSFAVFKNMDQKSVSTWSAIIAAKASLGLWYECLMLYGDMNSLGFWRPEESILVNVVCACAHLGALHLGKCAHGSLLRNISSLNVIVHTSLINMYAKCGAVQEAVGLFKKTADKNQLSYSATISGLAMHGRGREALELLSEMLREGLKPDDVTYVGVLSACSHCGLVDEGLQVFEQMKSDEVEPTIQHYGCMVDLLGRAGLLVEAYNLISNMPMKPNDIVWRSLLSTCKVHQNLEIGEIAANELLQSNSKNPGDYLLLSYMYARTRRWEDVSRVRTELAEKGIYQAPGFSSVEVQRKIYRFFSQDAKCPHYDGICDMIHQMEWQLKFEGYVPDTSQVLLNVQEEEKRQRLRGHSQKLAIAFALLNSSGGSPIRITRNLRMCSDCHTYTKYISSIYEREITVRDRNRFHHFRDGTCSCNDFWLLA
ncbi:pentatricopeptide repeat-containing protein At1g31920 [Rhodamnia argentea]|uniref:Pentatricopeptide repeat-containing protein At1g31920 n=1 Tax=Rhodamnia argentea TaxID=178133 RepID=A0A8B8MQ85_9MYRT|nr:pentatricopeptide repeat-containing protein At1g31920 [Rhodamnia argentea]